jgi:hypothetical protein
MRRQFNRNLFVFAAASALAACATNAPVDTSVKAPASASKPAAAPATTAVAADDKKAGKGYRQITKNGEEYFCRREAVTGSRTEVVETCLTKAQMDNIANNSQDLVRRMNTVPGSMPGVDSNGGQTNTVMGR